MFKRKVLIALISFVCSIALCAEQSDMVFAAVKAKNEKEVTRLLQGMALSRNYTQLDIIQEKNPELFEAKFFPDDFINKVIFTYVESAAAKAKEAQKATGGANPYAKNSWQWFVWDLDTALASRAATKDATVKKTLTDQITKDIASLKTALKGYLTADEQLAINLYLYAVSAGVAGADSEAEIAERLNVKFAKEANEILEYLFKAGVPFAKTLPAALKLSEWKRLETAYTTYVKTTQPDKKTEYETTAEYEARGAESKRLDQMIRSIELTLPAKLILGEYNVEEGYFTLSVTVPELPKSLKLREKNTVSVRYYIKAKNAAFFKESAFDLWSATAVVYAREIGKYSLKELQIKKGKESVTEGLCAFALRKIRGPENETIISINSFIPGIEYEFALKKVTGFETRIPISADGTYALVRSGDAPIKLWESALTAKMGFNIGDPGTAGGYIFFDKGSFSDGWQYGECADEDIGRMSLEEAEIACKNYRGGNVADWYVPGMDALNWMYRFLHKNQIGNFFGDYWSSTINESSGYPMLFSFWDPEENRGMQSSTELNVRPWRVF